MGLNNASWITSSCASVSGIHLPTRKVLRHLEIRKFLSKIHLQNYVMNHLDHGKIEKLRQYARMTSQIFCVRATTVLWLLRRTWRMPELTITSKTPRNSPQNFP
eukprot:PhF_6_TR41645/c5_g2_i4/m.63134